MRIPLNIWKGGCPLGTKIKGAHTGEGTPCPTCFRGGKVFISSQKDFRNKTGRSRKWSEGLFKQEYALGGRADRQVRNCPECLWQAGYEGPTNEGMEYSLGKEGFRGHIPWISSQLHLPEGRRDFCPYFTWIRSVMASAWWELLICKADFIVMRA